MKKNVELIDAYKVNLADCYCIKVGNLIREKYKIPMQYETISIGGNSDDMHGLCKKIDRYLLHIVEEISEFLDEFHKVEDGHNFKDHKECLMELIDVIAYIASLSSILLIDKFGLDYIKGSQFIPDYGESMILKSEINRLNEEDIESAVNKKLLSIERILINGIRRKFPERKWHKDVNRTLSVTELLDLYDTCIGSSLSAMREAIMLFLYLTDCDYKLFTEMFLDKNEKVYSLKK